MKQLKRLREMKRKQPTEKRQYQKGKMMTLKGTLEMKGFKVNFRGKWPILTIPLMIRTFPINKVQRDKSGVVASKNKRQKEARIITEKTN